MRRILAAVIVCLFSVMITSGLSSCGAGDSVSQTSSPSSLPDSHPVESAGQSGNLSNGDNILIAYFSRSGNTEIIANLIHEQTGGDLFRIITAKPYPENYDDILEAATQEKKENARPELASAVDNMADYDIIFIGYPIWWGDTPMAVLTFLESYDFSGKTLIPFCTSGSSSPQTSYRTIENTLPDAEIRDGFWTPGAQAADARDDIAQWLQRL